VSTQHYGFLGSDEHFGEHKTGQNRKTRVKGGKERKKRGKSSRKYAKTTGQLCAPTFEPRLCHCMLKLYSLNTSNFVNKFNSLQT